MANQLVRHGQDVRPERAEHPRARRLDYDGVPRVYDAALYYEDASRSAGGHGYAVAEPGLGWAFCQFSPPPFFPLTSTIRHDPLDSWRMISTYVHRVGRGQDG